VPDQQGTGAARCVRFPACGEAAYAFEIPGFKAVIGCAADDVAGHSALLL